MFEGVRDYKKFANHWSRPRYMYISIREYAAVARRSAELAELVLMSAAQVLQAILSHVNF